MSRYFTDITKEDFLKKFRELCLENNKSRYQFATESLDLNLPDSVYKDLKKVDFSFENTEWEEGNEFMNYPCGYKELHNGMHCVFINAGGDWETPVCFVVYWDGTSMRGYIPKSGNAWNRKAKCAFGNEGEIGRDEDYIPGLRNFLKESLTWIHKKTIPSIKDILTKTDNEILENNDKIIWKVLVSETAIIEDITKRIIKKS